MTDHKLNGDIKEVGMTDINRPIKIGPKILHDFSYRPMLDGLQSFTILK
jgi:hypothetical protein